MRSTSDGHEEWDAGSPYAVVRESTEVLLPTPPELRHVACG